MKTVGVLFAGDFAPCRRYESVISKEQENIFGEALAYIKKADLAFVNLECPLTDQSEAISKSGPALKARAETATALSRAGFSVVGLANNHILDYGPEGLKDTLDTCHSLGLSVVGAGMDLNCAQQPFVAAINGTKVAIIAVAEPEFSQAGDDGAGAAPIDPIDNYRQIMHAHAIADIVLVTVHGGNEYFPFPRPGLRKLCQFYIDLGVDAVICHHPHVPGAYELYQQKPIFYCLGNFIFDAADPPRDWAFGYMVYLQFDSETKSLLSFELIPYEQSVAIGGVKILKNKEKSMFLERIDGLRAKLEDQISWLNEWRSLVEERAHVYLRRQYSPVQFKGLGVLWRLGVVEKLFFRRNTTLAKLNLIRCESHRELLQASLELKIQDATD